MELFTTIEFKVEEFDKINKIIYQLTSEGWVVIDEKTYSIVKSNNGGKVITAKKYWFMRMI